MTKILFAFGTRPEAIKLAPVILEAKKNPKIDVKVVVSAQHRQMLDQVLRIFDIVPDIDLNLMSHSQGLNQICSRVIQGIDEILSNERPHWTVVHGDTSTTMAAAMASFHRQIPVAHIEAGLRTYDMQSPFPEEMNRQVVGLLSHLHFVPTEMAKANLLKEGKPEKSIHMVGNTVIDALMWVLTQFSQNPELVAKLDRQLPQLDSSKKTVLVTMHRRENFEKGLASISQAIAEVARTHGNVQFIIPLHLNPVVQKTVREILDNIPQVRIIEPQEYLPFIRLIQLSDIILTDSGGLQEEAPSLGKPLLVLRNETERPEAIAAGCAKLVGTDKGRIVNELKILLAKTKSNLNIANPYGDGKSSQRIIQVLQTPRI